MSFIQEHIQQRNVFVILLIAFLCISLLLFAEPTVASILWGIISAAGTIISFISLIWIDIGDLDDEIDDLKDDISKLDIKYLKHHSKYISYKLKENNCLEKVTEYEGKLATARSEKTSAEQRAKDQKYNYVTAKYYSDLAYNRFIKHWENCHYCQTDINSCAECKSRYDLWQSKKAETDKWEKAWNAAKLDITLSIQRIGSATRNIKHNKIFAAQHKRFKESAKASRDKVGGKIDDKVAEKKEKKRLRDEKKKERKKYRKQVKALQKEVKAEKAKDPEAYAEALEEDPELKEEIERLLDYEPEE